jgi:lincosamide nucleotidyltransferase B/F
VTDRRSLLLARLESIGRSLAADPGALALLGLGSCGTETERLDEYSDLDFFVIVEPGRKGGFLDDLRWLERVAPIAYRYRNTDDGWKAIFEDGVLCEFAVFEPAELPAIPFEPGRVVWKREGFDEATLRPTRPLEPPPSHSPEWLLGEALTNLYVGLGRYRRGEGLSGARMVQYHAVECVLELTRGTAPFADAFAPNRRYESHAPTMAHALPGFMQGYARTRESALTILEFLERHFPVNARMASLIRELCSVPEESD